MEQLGLFPLSLVVLPGERVPLHIFEPRYRELVGEAMELDEPFGILLEDDEGLRTVGTRVQVTEVVERFEDGRFVVIVEGLERFQLDHETEGRSFRTGEVEPVEDRDDTPGEESRAEAITLFEELRDAVGAEVDTPDRDEPELAWAIAARVEVDLSTKQLLLESRSERERLELVISHLRSASAQLELLKEQSALVRRNGNLRGAT